MMLHRHLLLLLGNTRATFFTPLSLQDHDILYDECFLNESFLRKSNQIYFKEDSSLISKASFSDNKFKNHLKKIYYFIHINDK
jgi:hypothetical protein